MDYKEYRELNSKDIMLKIMECREEKDWWDYVTALRGPDKDMDGKIKELFTCFVRGNKVMGYTGSLGIPYFEKVLDHLVFSSSPSSKDSNFVFNSFVKNLNGSDYHWINHMRDALITISSTFGGEVAKVANLLIEILPRLFNPVQAGGLRRSLLEIHKIVNKKGE